MIRLATRSTRARAFAAIVLVQLALSSCSVAGWLAGCPPIAPAELPSGAPPGEAVEGVSGGTKQFVWGSGRDIVDQAIGLTYRAEGLDPVLANVTVRGHPAIVYQLADSTQLGLEWSESADCDYHVRLAPEITAEELAEYAGRY